MISSKVKIEIFFVTLVLAFCSITYELLLANTLALVTGSYIWWQSLTIGVYIGGLGLGAFYSEKITNTLKSLFNIEIALAFLGAISVTYIYFFHSVYRYIDSLLLYMNGDFYSISYLQNLFVMKIIFFVVIELLTLAIGFCSGFEIPLLLKWSNLKSADLFKNDNIILALNYIGTLIGTLVFAYFFMTKFDVVKTSIIVSFCNWGICLYFYIKYIQENKKYYLMILSIVGALIFTIGFNQENITQIYLKFYYYLPIVLSKNNQSFGELINRIDHFDSIERTKSLYQYVDIFQYPFRDELTKKNATILTLDTNFQFSSETEIYYHESFAHLPIAFNNCVPKKILVLGGGDGLLIRELLKHPEIESIHHIELDQKMVDLANSRFALLNQNSLKNSKVHVEINDGFYYLRNTNDKFDAIYIDFPYPNSYDLAKLYSIEFYKYVLNALNPNGFAVLDAPFYARNENVESDSAQQFKQVFTERQFLNNSVLASTIFYAGFKTMLPYRILDESFLFLKKEPGLANYNISDNKYISDVTLLVKKDVGELKNLNYPYKISEKYINSIFKPMLSRKDDF